MKIWTDAQLSPFIAAWLNRTFSNVNAQSLRALGLREAHDREVFDKAKSAGVILMTKDQDFLSLLSHYGPPPQIIWITCGNTSNARMCEILESSLPGILKLLKSGESLIEVSGRLKIIE